MKFFVDTADTAAIKELNDAGLINGVTTNPSLIAKSGRDFKEVIKEICAITPDPVSAEVASLEYDGMVAEGEHLAKIAKNGLAPATLLSHIAGHAGWLSKPEVRRALLSNSRLPAQQAERVLRALPQTELRLVPSQGGYPPAIRTLARRLLQRDPEIQPCLVQLRIALQRAFEQRHGLGGPA